MSFCYKCGSPLPENARFCPECGARQPEKKEMPAENNSVVKDETAAPLPAELKPEQPLEKNGIEAVDSDQNPETEVQSVSENPAEPENSSETEETETPATAKAMNDQQDQTDTAGDAKTVAGVEGKRSAENKSGDSTETIESAQADAEKVPAENPNPENPTSASAAGITNPVPTPEPDSALKKPADKPSPNSGVLPPLPPIPDHSKNASAVGNAGEENKSSKKTLWIGLGVAAAILLLILAIAIPTATAAVQKSRLSDDLEGTWDYYGDSIEKVIEFDDDDLEYSVETSYDWLDTTIAEFKWKPIGKNKIEVEGLGEFTITFLDDKDSFIITPALTDTDSEEIFFRSGGYSEGYGYGMPIDD